FKQEYAGDEFGSPKNRGLMRGAVGIDQESVTPIAGRRSYAKRLVRSPARCASGRTRCDTRACGAEIPTRSLAAPAGSGRVRFVAIANRAARPYASPRSRSE